MKDNVLCCNCGKRVLVECGEDICSKCGYEGALAWIDGEEQEVEDDYNIEKKVTIKITKEDGLFFIYINDVLNRKVLRQEELYSNLEYLKRLYHPEEIIRGY